MKTFLLFALALLAMPGCSSTAMRSHEYSGGASATVPAYGQHIHHLIVRFHPTQPLASVMPPASNRLAESLSSIDSEWTANLDFYRTMYRSALEGEMEKTGRKCAIRSDHVYPEFYMIEYSLSC